MGDLISKHDVLKLIENTPYDWSNITERTEMLRKIKALPSANVPDTNVGEWTPCSEGLPKRNSSTQKRGWYFTTNACGSVGVTKYEFDGSSLGFGWDSDIRIIAWMSLPEPWKGADDE